MTDEQEGLAEGLARLRHLTRMTGAIHEAQLLQLKMWPKLLFPCDSHTIAHDSEQRLLTVTMQLSGDLPEDTKQRIENFEKWCWDLLGPEWAVVLLYRTGKARGKAKVLHRGRRAAALRGAASVAVQEGERIIAEFRRYSKPDTKQAQSAIDDLGPIVED